MIKKLDFLTSFSFKNLLNNKRFTIPVSLFLALIFWLLIVTKENPIIPRSFADLTVNVNLENTFAFENGMNIVEDISQQKFTVVVRGPSYLVSTLKVDDFNLYASAANVDAPGEYNLDVVASPVSPNSGYEVLSVSPSTVKVNFDYIDTKEFTIKAVAENVTAKEGLIAENAIVSGTENDTITITGPRTVINKIDSVIALTKVNKMLAVSQTFDADILLYDIDFKEIDPKNLTLSTNNVKVTVPISKKKVVPVEVDLSNLPNGFDKSSLKFTLNHNDVTIIGTPDSVDKANKIVLSAIDITKISKTSNSFDVSPKLPEGIRLLDNIEFFTVKFNTDNYIERTFDVSVVNSANLTQGLTVKTTGLKNVKICGPRSVLNNLRASSIFGVVDLKDKKAGEHSLEIKIEFQSKNNIWAVGAYTTTVTIK